MGEGVAFTSHLLEMSSTGDVFVPLSPDAANRPDESKIINTK